MKIGKNDHCNLVYEIAKGLKAVGRLRNYLEIGISKGATFNKIAPMCGTAYAVDIQIKCREHIKHNKNAILHIGDSDSFFKRYNESFDLVFIDADHHYYALQDDFLNVTKMIHQGTVILIHDTHPPTEEYKEHCHNGYDYMTKLKSTDIELVTLPCYTGLSIIRLMDENKTLDWE